MSHRFPALWGLALAALATAWMLPATAHGQSQSAAAPASSTWTVPRTPDGHPDLQGIWTNNTTTPLERPSKYGDKAFLTDEELAAETQRVVEGFRQDLSGREVRAMRPGAVTDVGRAYNSHWFERNGKPINRTSLIIDPPNGKMPELLPQARERFAAWAKTMGLFNQAASPYGSLWNGGGNISSVLDEDGVPVDGTDGGVDGRGSRADGPEDRRLSERCIIMGPLPRMPGGYNNNVQIVQTADHVVLQMEMIHDARVIPVDGRPHLPPHVRQWWGDSRGRWEGDTLVIETRNLNEKAPFKSSFEGRRVIERLTRVNADTVEYQVTIEDPSTWTRPWTVSWPMTRLQPTDDVKVPQMFEYACHEGNTGLAGQLRGTRAAEKVAQAAQSR